MKALDSTQASSQLKGLVHLETQDLAWGLALTVNRIFRLTSAGHLDFGGSEYRAADRVEMEAKLRDSGEKYGWWDLDGGTYLIRYNETLALKEGQVALLAPRPETLQAGASHPTSLLGPAAAELETLLYVSADGIHLKQNCRLSRLVILEAAPS